MKNTMSFFISLTIALVVASCDGAITNVSGQSDVLKKYLGATLLSMNIHRFYSDAPSIDPLYLWKVKFKSSDDRILFIDSLNGYAPTKDDMADDYGMTDNLPGWWDVEGQALEGFKKIKQGRFVYIFVDTDDDVLYIQCFDT